MSVLDRLLIEFRTRLAERGGRRSDEGQGLAEYALILTIIAIASIVVLAFIGSQISGALNWIGQSIQNAGP